MRRLIAPVALLAIAACVHDAEPADHPYAAIGTEPFWSVKVAEGRMIYEGLDQRPVSVPAPARRATANGYRYESARLTLDVVHRQCSDGMSDRIYADTVTVTVDGRTLDGCGGAIEPPADLEGTNWSIVAIGDEAVSGDAYVLRFADGRIGGKAGCNGFSGPYRLNGDRIEAGPIAATEMACPGARMRHEQAAFTLLAAPMTVEHPSGDTLVLRGASGSMTLRRSI